jgi:ABC-type ATPase with predicted acetyltransferase domain
MTYSAPHSTRLMKAAAIFGLRLTGSGRAARPDGEVLEWRRRVGESARRVVAEVGEGRVVLLTGPSGAGKSVVLGAVGRACASGVGGGGGWRVCALSRSAEDRLDARVVVDVPGLPLRGALSALSRAGLAEARLLSRRADRLSRGERWRLALAEAFGVAERNARAGRRTLLLADEFATALDAGTGTGVASAVRRWARSGVPVCVVAATVRGEVAAHLEPDAEFRVVPGGGLEVVAGEAGGGEGGGA